MFVLTQKWATPLCNTWDFYTKPFPPSLEYSFWLSEWATEPTTRTHRPETDKPGQLNKYQRNNRAKIFLDFLIQIYNPLSYPLPPLIYILWSNKTGTSSFESQDDRAWTPPGAQSRYDWADFRGPKPQAAWAACDFKQGFSLQKTGLSFGV